MSVPILPASGDLRIGWALGFSLLLVAGRLAAQVPPELASERADYLVWLTTAANSPLAAIARQPLGTGVRLGPDDADVPLPGLAEHRVFPEGRAVVLEGPSGKRSLPRDRPIHLGTHILALTGTPPDAVLILFRSSPEKGPPGYYEYAPTLVFEGRLHPPAKPGTVRVLGPDGLEVEAAEAGTVLVPIGGATRLKVLRLPVAGTEESELEIYFRDETNGHGSYPAGRFVSLIPLANGTYRLDFNRSRNPFCAYSSVYPCPAPWRGNVLAAPVRAGERYAGGGVEAPPAAPEVQ